MRIRTLTQAKITELKNQHETKLALYNEIESKSEKDLWKIDLDKFLDIYKKRLKNYNELIEEQIKNDINKATTKKKKTTKSKK